MHLPIRPLLFASFALALAGSIASANTAADPAPRSGTWIQRHEGFVEIAKKGGVDVLFLGDSITDFWRRAPNDKNGGLEIWERDFAPLRAENFGVGGDRTQHVLWRVENGEAEGINPKVVVLMIGTNNLSLEADKITPRNTAAEVAGGVAAIVKSLQVKFPSVKILLLAIFPRGEKDSAPRQRVDAANREIAKLHDGKRVHFLNINAKFLEPDGTLSPSIMPDLLHPNPKGYEIWAAAIKQPLAKLLR